MHYQLGLYEKSMPNELSIEQKLEAAKAAGFDHVEISIDETDEKQARLAWSASERADIRRAIEHVGIPISTMCLSGHRKWALGSHDATTRERGDQIFVDAVDLARDLGIRIIQLAGYDVYYEEGDDDTRRWFAEGIARGVEYAACRGVLTGFETMEPAFMNTISKAMVFVDEVNSPYLGVYPDFGNLYNACEEYGIELEDEFEAGRGHIVALHLKETVPGVFRDMRYGEGRNDFVRGIRAATAVGVHLFVGEFWHDGRENWEEGLKEANDFLRGKFAEAIG